MTRWAELFLSESPSNIDGVLCASPKLHGKIKKEKNVKLSPISCASFVALAGFAMPAWAASATPSPKQSKTYEIARGTGVVNSWTMNACANIHTLTNDGAIEADARNPEHSTGTVSHNGAVTVETTKQHSNHDKKRKQEAQMHCDKSKGKAGKHEPTMQPSPQPESLPK